MKKLCIYLRYLSEKAMYSPEMFDFPSSLPDTSLHDSCSPVEISQYRRFKKAEVVNSAYRNSIRHPCNSI